MEKLPLYSCGFFLLFDVRIGTGANTRVPNCLVLLSSLWSSDSVMLSLDNTASLSNFRAGYRSAVSIHDILGRDHEGDSAICIYSGS